MYGYIDESIVWVNGRKYLFLGFVVYNTRCSYSEILRTFSASRSQLKAKHEIKYTNVRNQRYKQKILELIKRNSEYYSSVFVEVENNSNVHDLINLLIERILQEYKSSPQNKTLIKVYYDKSSYKIDIHHILNEFKFVQSFEMSDSVRSFGVQHADWIVGEAGDIFKQKNQSK